MTTRDEILAAPMFAVFPGSRPVPPRLPLFGAAGPWCIIESRRYDYDVEIELLERGIPNPGGFEAQRDDGEAPEGFTDVDAAVLAIAEGYSLVKLPNDMTVAHLLGQPAWGMFVLDARPRSGDFRIAVPDLILDAVVQTQAVRARLARLREINAAAQRYKGAWLDVDRDLVRRGLADVHVLGPDERVIEISDSGELALLKGDRS